MEKKVLETAGTILNFKKGDVVIQPMESNRCLYRLHKGSVNIEIGEEEKKIEIQPMKGDTFNDLSLLEHIDSTYELVTVTSTEASISVIQIAPLFRLLKGKVGLALRFFQTMAVHLARRVSVHREHVAGKLGRADSTQKTQHKIINALKEWASSDEFLAKDKQFSEVFDLSSEEVVLHEFTCSFGKLGKQRGDLYITKNFLCFGAHASKQKLKIKFSDVQSVSMAGKQSLRVKTTSHLLPFNFYDFDNFFQAFDSIFEVYKRSLLQTINSSKSSSEVSKKLKDTSVQSFRRNSKVVEKVSKKKIFICLFFSYPCEQHAATKILTADDWNVLASIAIKKKFKKGENIPSASTRIYQLVKGTCQITFMSLGKSFECKQGDVWGEVAVLSGAESDIQVGALGNVEVLVFENSLLQNLFLRCPNLSTKFYYHLSVNMAEKLKLLMSQLGMDRMSTNNFI